MVWITPPTKTRGRRSTQLGLHTRENDTYYSLPCQCDIVPTLMIHFPFPLLPLRSSLTSEGTPAFRPVSFSFSAIIVLTPKPSCPSSLLLRRAHSHCFPLQISRTGTQKLHTKLNAIWSQCGPPFEAELTEDCLNIREAIFKKKVNSASVMETKECSPVCLLFYDLAT